MKEAYFKSAKDWHTERYQLAQVERNRWFLAFIVSVLFSISLVIALIMITPLKTVVPLIVHHNTTTGEMFVKKIDTPYLPVNEAQVQADLVSYVTHRESYTFADLNQRYRLVMLKSSRAVAKQYADLQSEQNKESPINQLGENGARLVRVEDVVFLDKETSKELHAFNKPNHNLAKVDFSTTTTDKDGKTSTTYWVATIAWTYLGLPTNQQEAWDNFNGFTITSYRVDPRNINH